MLYVISPGTFGVTEAEVLLSALVPIAFVAVILNEYAVRLVRPVTVMLPLVG